MVRRKVDLPEPVGPMRAVMVPRWERHVDIGQDAGITEVEAQPLGADDVGGSLAVRIEFGQYWVDLAHWRLGGLGRQGSHFGHDGLGLFGSHWFPFAWGARTEGSTARRTWAETS